MSWFTYFLTLKVLTGCDLWWWSGMMKIWVMLRCFRAQHFQRGLNNGGCHRVRCLFAFFSSALCIDLIMLYVNVKGFFFTQWVIMSKMIKSVSLKVALWTTCSFRPYFMNENHWPCLFFLQYNFMQGRLELVYTQRSCALSLKMLKVKSPSLFSVNCISELNLTEGVEQHIPFWQHASCFGHRISMC